MIIDTIDNLRRYICLCPLIQSVVDYLSSHSLEDLTDGRHEVSGEDVWVNVQTCPLRAIEDVPLEVHRQMMDIQIPLDTQEVHGFSTLTDSELRSASYDVRSDISFFSIPPQTYFSLSSGQFALYLPGEGHAPAITDRPIRKAVFKVKYQTPL